MFPNTPLYVVCDAEVCAQAGWTLIDFARACLDGGATLLQVRAKEMSGGALLTALTAIVDLARRAGATIIVNDRVDLARLAAADGVHLGQEDLPPQAVRELSPAARMVVGLSTHSDDQVAAALAEPIDYLAMGPVFATRTKRTGYDPRGLDMIRSTADRLRDAGLPLVAIGGITLAQAPSVIEAGAHSVAVISDLIASGDPAARVREFLRVLR